MSNRISCWVLVGNGHNFRINSDRMKTLLETFHQFSLLLFNFHKWHCLSLTSIENIHHPSDVISKTSYKFWTFSFVPKYCYSILKCFDAAHEMISISSSIFSFLQSSSNQFHSFRVSYEVWFAMEKSLLNVNLFQRQRFLLLPFLVSIFFFYVFCCDSNTIHWKWNYQIEKSTIKCS